MKFTKERFPLIFSRMNGNNNDALNTKPDLYTKNYCFVCVLPRLEKASMKTRITATFA